MKEKIKGYRALHIRMRQRISKPELCQYCGIKEARDLANISQSYLEELTDWEWLCRTCHMRKDNRMSNLFHQQRQYIFSSNTSGYRGVSWFKPKNRWRALIYANKKQIFIGYFKDKIKAVLAYNEAAKKYHGIKAKLNYL